MKHIILIVLFLAFNTNYSQKKDCCDSLNKARINKKLHRRVTTQKPQDIYISLDNSNSNNNGITKCDSCKLSNASSKKVEKIKSFDWYELYKNLITIFLGLVAAFVALKQAKSNIISSARIRWNEDLRDSLSKLYSAAVDTRLEHGNYIYTKSNGTADSSLHYSQYTTNLSAFNSISNKVMMLLNSNEIEHRNIEIIIDKIDKMLGTANINSITQQELEIELKKIVASSKIIFKKEWEKSKNMFRH